MHHRIHRSMWGSVTILMITLLFGVSVISAQDDCAAFTQTTWETAAEVCGDLSVDTVCYGHGDIFASLNTDGARFETISDTVAVEAITTLQLAPFDLATGIWGIAYTSLAADGGVIEVIMMGNVMLETLTGDEITFVSGMSDHGTCPGPVDGVLVTATTETPASFTLNGEAFSFGAGAHVFCH